MQIKECYEMMDANYQDVLSRLVSDKLIYKFNKKFALADDYEQLVRALEVEDYELAFRMSHNLKGNSLNLGYSGLFAVSNEICEALRGGKPTVDVMPMLAKVTEKYHQVIAGIEQMDEV